MLGEDGRRGTVVRDLHAVVRDVRRDSARCGRRLARFGSQMDG
jgi:hypothetical protein